MSASDRRDIESAQLYLQTLTEHAPARSLLDVRYRAGRSGIRRFFASAHARETALTLVRLSARADVYLGVAPRIRRSGSRRDTAPTAMLWADLDTPEAMEGLKDFKPAPAMVISSGRGLHVYWPLTEPLSAGQLERANRRLAFALQADIRCVDVTRVLRPPGTRNHKYEPPRPVELTYHSQVRYAPAELLAALPREPARAAVPKGLAAPRRPDDPLLAIEPERYIHVLTGQRPGRDHKIHCPFHDDRNPSLHVYGPGRGWACYACMTPDGRPLGGDIYTLGSLLFGVPASGPGFLELRGRLDSLFGVIR